MEDTDYVLGRTKAEYDRLIEQAELLRPLTERMLRAAGIGPGMHVLDIGCGVGDVSFLVSELVGPEGSVVGVDLDDEVLHFAEERRAVRRITNVVFRQANALDGAIHFERLFDAAVGRMVLVHMSDPTAALRLIAERVRSGGIVAFHESVIPLASALNLPVLASFNALNDKALERSGGRLIGAELYWRMQEAGLEPEPRPLAEVAMCVGQGAVAYRRWSLIARSLIPKIVEYGLATEEEVLDTIERPLRDELMDTRGLVPLSLLMIGQWARKP